MKKTIPQMEPWFDETEAKAVYEYMKSGGWVTEFKKTEELEEKISRYTGARYCVMTNNGTVSLILALLALELKAGDEVLVPNLTMIATPNSAAILGIKPILVDIEPKTLCMDIDKAKKAITSRTKAVMYVPFNGRCGQMENIVDFCRKNNLFLVEDAAQALGSFYKGKHLGTFGDIGSFSFSTPKIISTGQGGALITNNAKLHKKIKMLKDFGRTRGGVDVHESWGWNFKFTDLAAVIGIEQMKKLPDRILHKKRIFEQYRKLLLGINQIEFIDTDLSETSPWFIDIFVPQPNKLQTHLQSNNIGSRRIYPVISSQKIYKETYKTKSFPVSEKYASCGLWLPSSSKLTDKEVETVVQTIQKYYND